MNYYFVFQNATYEVESNEGFIWAPTTQHERYVHSHVRVGNLEIGDHIVHCAKGRIYAFSKVKSAPKINTNE